LQGTLIDSAKEEINMAISRRKFLWTSGAAVVGLTLPIDYDLAGKVSPSNQLESEITHLLNVWAGSVKWRKITSTVAGPMIAGDRSMASRLFVRDYFDDHEMPPTGRHRVKLGYGSSPSDKYFIKHCCVASRTLDEEFVYPGDEDIVFELLLDLTDSDDLFLE
jgi:hypothetical protein